MYFTFLGFPNIAIKLAINYQTHCILRLVIIIIPPHSPTNYGQIWSNCPIFVKRKLQVIENQLLANPVVPRAGIEDMKTGDFIIFAHNHAKWRSSAFYVGFDRVSKAFQRFNSFQGHSKQFSYVGKCRQILYIFA